MPYIDRATYDLIPRVTEITSSLECENKAYEHPVHTGKKKWMTQSNSVSLKGTLVHQDIEDWIRSEFEFEPVRHELTGGDKILLARFMEDTNKLRWLQESREKAMVNFKLWFGHFDPEPLLLEQTMVYLHEENGKVIPKKSCKGTVDFIGVFYPDTMTDIALEILPIQSPYVVIVDWKSGVARMKGYETQIQAYHWLYNKLGISAKLPTHAKKIPLADFGSTTLFGSNVRADGTVNWKTYMKIYHNISQYTLWLKARQIFFDPQPIVRNHLEAHRSDWREGYGCVFCMLREKNCPIFLTGVEDYTEEVDLLKMGELK